VEFDRTATISLACPYLSDFLRPQISAMAHAGHPVPAS